MGLCLAHSAALAAPNADKHLVAHYSLDEGRGMVARDKSANHLHGKIHGGTWIKTEAGHALRFGGSGGYVDLGRAPHLKITGDTTIMAWVKLMPDVFPDGKTNWTIVDCEKYRDSGFIFRVDGASGRLVFRMSRPGSAQGVYSKKSLRPNTYYHVVVLKKGKSVTCFLDGFPDSRAGAESPAAATVPFRISTAGQSFDGIIADLKVYDRAVSRAEIIAEFKKGADSRGKDASGAFEAWAADAKFVLTPKERRAATRFFKKHPEAVAFKETGKILLLANREVGIQFAKRHKSVSVSRIYGIKADEDFLSDHEQAQYQEFWQVELRTDNGRGISTKLTNFSRAEFSHEVERDESAVTLRLKWQGFDLPEAPKCVDVEVLVALNAGDPLSRWRINVKNRGKTYGIWNVMCPFLPLSPIGGDPKTNVLTGPQRRGNITHAPFLESLRRYHLSRCPGGFNMQFQALYDGSGKGLYLATHDGGGCMKEYHWVSYPEEQYIEYGVRHLPANMGYPGEDFRMRYDVCIGPFFGDWYDACRVYRKWALKQVWCSKGPLAARQDIPCWFKECPVMLVAATPRGDSEVPWVRDRTLDMLRFLETELPICWYTWKKHVPEESHYNNPDSPWRVPEKRKYPCSNIHDGNYPVLSAVESFSDACKAIKTAGGHVKPYVCARIFDPGLNENSPLAKGAKPNVVRNITGKIVPGESTRTNVAWRMCPYTKWWQDRMAETVRELIRNEHVGGIYFDTFTGGAIQCFDTRHGHSHGGGNAPYLGARELALAARAAMKEADAQSVITGENSSETAIDLLDGLLYAYTITRDTVPMFATVYGDYMVRYGRNVTPESEMFYLQCATLFTEGAQMGRLSLTHRNPVTKDTVDYLKDFAEGSEFAEQMRFIRKLARYWKPDVGAKYLAFGQLLRPLKFREPDPMPMVSLSTDWLKRRRLAPVFAPVLQSGVFKGRDGSLGIFIVNVTEKPISFRFELTPGRHPISKTGKYYVTRISETGESLGRVGSPEGKVAARGKIAAHDVVFLEARR